MWWWWFGCRIDPEAQARQGLASELLALVGDPAELLLPPPPEDPTASDAYAAFPQDPLNPITPEKVALGAELFYETGLASYMRNDASLHSVSCASCHNPETGFASGTYLGRGFGEGAWGHGIDRHPVLDDIHQVDIGPWNDTRLVNIGYRGERGGWQGEFDVDLVDEDDTHNEKPCALYDRGYTGLDCYAYVSLNSHGLFMGGEPAPPDSVLSPDSGLEAYWDYKELFDAAFPDWPEEDRMTRTGATLAATAFARVVVTSEAPFQLWLRQAADPEGDPLHDVPMSDQALQGALLFFGEAHCTQCHVGPGLTAAAYANIGSPAFDEADTLVGVDSKLHPGQDMSLREYFEEISPNYPPLVNDGRAAVTLESEDFGAYEIVSAYGAGAPGITRFGHGGAHSTLESWIRHKVSGSAGPTIDPRLADSLDPALFSHEDPWLDDDEIAALTAFLAEGLTDPTMEQRFGRPDHTSLAGFCTPNNDPESCATYEALRSVE